jgi:protein-disulfide isomerase
MNTTFARAALFAVPFLIAACGGANSQGSSQGQDAAETPTVGETPATTADASGGKAEMFWGSADAPVTVIEYASVTCPHCATFHETILPEIKEKYIDTGKVKLVFRDFPTPPQGLSYVGSVLARCAAEKGGKDAYFLVLGSLFKTQKTWVYGEDPKAELQKIAAQAGMDQAEFDACMQRQDLVDVVSANVRVGNEEHGVDSTPTFILNGEKLPNMRSAEEFGAELDKALASAEG